MPGRPIPSQVLAEPGLECFQASLLAPLEAQKVDGLMWETLLLMAAVVLICWLTWQFVEE